MSKEKISNIKKEFRNEELEEYNSYITNLIKNPINWGNPPKNEINVSQSFTGPCRDTMWFFLKINNNTIEKANFITDGCGASFATASQTTILIEGKTIEYANKLTAEDIDNALNGLPEDHKHCAELAIKTLKRALKKYQNRK